MKSSKPELIVSAEFSLRIITSIYPIMFVLLNGSHPLIFSRQRECLALPSFVRKKKFFFLQLWNEPFYQSHQGGKYSKATIAEKFRPRTGKDLWWNSVLLHAACVMVECYLGSLIHHCFNDKMKSVLGVLRGSWEEIKGRAFSLVCLVQEKILKFYQLYWVFQKGDVKTKLGVYKVIWGICMGRIEAGSKWMQGDFNAAQYWERTGTRRVGQGDSQTAPSLKKVLASPMDILQAKVVLQKSAPFHVNGLALVPVRHSHSLEQWREIWFWLKQAWWIQKEATEDVSKLCFSQDEIRTVCLYGYQGCFFYLW